MKFPALIVVLFASATYAVFSADSGIRVADDAPDGLYTHTFDEVGNENVTFVPYEQLAKRTDTETFFHYTERSDKGGPSRIEARRSACGPGTANLNDIINAEYQFKTSIGKQLNLLQGTWHYVSVFISSPIALLATDRIRSLLETLSFISSVPTPLDTRA
jgi:hypothetical protein